MQTYPNILRSYGLIWIEQTKVAETEAELSSNTTPKTKMFLIAHANISEYFEVIWSHVDLIN